MAITPDSIVILSERYGSGEPMTDAEIDDIRKNVEPSTWLNLCRAREAAISAKAPKQLGPMSEGTQVRLKSGGPVMTVEDTRDSQKLVQCIWFDDAHHVQRDAFHKDALVAASSPLILDEPKPNSRVWRRIGYAQLAAVCKDDAAIDQIACEIYRAIIGHVATPGSGWQALGDDARNVYRDAARAAMTAFAELQE